MFGWINDGYVKWSTEASHFPWSGVSSTNAAAESSDEGNPTDAESNADPGGATTI
jgi:hypothetical protein